MEMVKKELMAFLKEEDGVGVIEIVLILVGNIYPIDYSIHYVDIVEKWKIYYCIDRSVYDVQWRL